MLNVNWNDVRFGVLLLAIAAVTVTAYYLRERRRIAFEETRWHREFDREMTNVPRPDWDGTTYEWPDQNLGAYLEDRYAYGQAMTDTRPQVRYAPPLDDYVPRHAPVPPSTISGPLPVQHAPVPQASAISATEAFLDEMRHRTDTWLANWAAP